MNLIEEIKQQVKELERVVIAVQTTHKTATGKEVTVNRGPDDQFVRQGVAARDVDFGLYPRNAQGEVEYTTDGKKGSGSVIHAPSEPVPANAKWLEYVINKSIAHQKAYKQAERELAQFNKEFDQMIKDTKIAEAKRKKEEAKQAKEKEKILQKVEENKKFMGNPINHKPVEPIPPNALRLKKHIEKNDRPHRSIQASGKGSKSI